MTINVGVYLYIKVEVLDFAGPFEVFSTTSRFNARIEPGLNKLFHVLTVEKNIHPLFARGALLLAKAGLLKSKTATTHWEDIDNLKSIFPDIIIIKSFYSLPHM